MQIQTEENRSTTTPNLSLEQVKQIEDGVKEYLFQIKRDLSLYFKGNDLEKAVQNIIEALVDNNSTIKLAEIRGLQNNVPYSAYLLESYLGGDVVAFLDKVHLSIDAINKEAVIDKIRNTLKNNLLQHKNQVASANQPAVPAFSLFSYLNNNHSHLLKNSPEGPSSPNEMTISTETVTDYTIAAPHRLPNPHTLADQFLQRKKEKQKVVLKVENEDTEHQKPSSSLNNVLDLLSSSDSDSDDEPVVNNSELNNERNLNVNNEVNHSSSPVFDFNKPADPPFIEPVVDELFPCLDSPANPTPMDTIPLPPAPANTNLLPMDTIAAPSIPPHIERILPTPVPSQNANDPISSDLQNNVEQSISLPMQNDPESPESSPRQNNAEQSANSSMQNTTAQPIEVRPLTPEEQKKYAADLYYELAQVVLDRINGFSRSIKFQRKHYKPFVKNIMLFGGAFCIPLPINDATKILQLINKTVEKINIATEAGDILCRSVKKFFIDFNAFFLGSYPASGFPCEEQLFFKTLTQDTPRIFSFDLKEKNHLKLLCLESQIKNISNKNHQQAITNSSVTKGVSDIVVQTLIYNQAQIILNVKEPEIETDDFNYWLICLLQLPSKARKTDITDLGSKDTVARLLLARAKPNNRLDAFFEVSHLKSGTKEYDTVLNLTQHLSAKLKDLLLAKTDEYSKEDIIANDYIILNQEELRNLIFELTENNKEQSQILPLFALEKNSQKFPKRDKNVNDEDTKRSKRKRKKDSCKLAKSKENVPSKIPKLSHNPHAPGGANPQAIINRVLSNKNFPTLFDYLNSLQEENIRKAKHLVDKVTRYVIKNFNFEKIVVTRPEKLKKEEQDQLNQFLESSKLFPHQKECVTNLITAYYSNIGLCVSDEMSLGKTVEIAASLRYLCNKKQGKPYLIVVPLPVLEKWSKDLLTHLPFSEKEIIIYHGPKARRNISAQTFRSDKIIITTYDTLLSELKETEQTVVKTALGYISKFSFLNLSSKSIPIWNNEILPNLHNVIGTDIITSKKSRSGKSTIKKIDIEKMNILRFPTQQELDLLENNYKIPVKDLKKLFTSEIIFHFLNRRGNLNKEGAILKPLSLISELDSLYTNFPDLTVTQQNLFDMFDKVYRGFSLAGIAFDEAHMLSKTTNQFFIFMHPIVKNLVARKGYRVIATGTPFQNDIEELWTLFEFLNPGEMLGQEEFMAAYENLIYKAGKAICNTSSHMGSPDIDGLNEILNSSVNKIKTIYNDLHKVITIFQQRQIRRTKKSIHDLAEQQTNQNTSYQLPKRIDDPAITWKLSAKQQELFNKEDPAAIENACRGFAYFNDAMKDKVSDEPSKKGYSLLQSLSKVFDHPIMVSDKHLPTLFNSKRVYKDLLEYLSNVIDTEYNKNINEFINESGKLSELMKILEPHVNNSKSRILISTEFIPMAAIIQLCLMKVYKISQPLIYFGGYSKTQREEVLQKFNDPLTSNNILLVSQKAGSEGIEVHADIVICYDQTWTHSQSEQIKSRAQRKGSPFETIHCLTFCGDNPLDRKMKSFVDEKKEWAKWFVDLHSSCDISWFVDRISNLVKTSILFKNFTINEENLEDAVEQIKAQIEMAQDLSLDQLRSNIRNSSQPVINERSGPANPTNNNNNSHVDDPDPMQVDPIVSPQASFSQLINSCRRSGLFSTGQYSPAQTPEDRTTTPQQLNT